MSRVLIFFIAVISLSICLPDAEKSALLDIYKSLGGDSWTNSSGWNSGKDPCMWFGVECDDTGSHVSQLLLGGNNLKGILPRTIGNFSQLVAFDFNKNKIQGPIPPEIGKLVNLYAFGAMFNMFTTLPEEIGLCTNLRFLHMDFNSFTGPIPLGLTKLKNLEYMGFYANDFSGPIPAFEDFLGLQYFVFTRNKLTGGFPKLVNMPALQVLSLGMNQLEGAVPDLSVFPSLVEVELFSNNFKGDISAALPSGISKDIIILNMHSNSFSGNLPESIRSLQKLLILGLNDNNLDGTIPSYIKELDGTMTDLSENPFACPIPDWAKFSGATCQSNTDVRTLPLRERRMDLADAKYRQPRSGDLVDVTVCGMPKCPDMKSMESLMETVFDEISGIIDYEISFIGEVDPYLPTGLFSMHGQAEAVGGLFEICAINLYSETLWRSFISCLNLNQTSIPTNVVECAKQTAGIEYGELEACAMSSKGISLLKNSALHCAELDAVWSPTVYLNGDNVCLWDSVPCDFKDKAGFVEEVCARYHGSSPPPICAGY